jgi:DNA-binding MarR family transcriptional regulator
MSGKNRDLALDLFVTSSRFSRSAAQVPAPRHPGVMWRVLSTLAYEGAMRTGQIALSERVSQSSMTTTVDRLERLGLVSRQPDPDDGRATLIDLTEAGADALREQRALIVGRLESYFDNLSDIDTAVLKRSIEIMRELVDVADGKTRSDPHVGLLTDP